jgi:translocation and assembly module TamB
LKWAAQWLLLLAVVILLLLALAPVTEPGSRVLVSLADRLTPLDIGRSSGTVLGQLRLESLSYRSDTVNLSVADIESSLAVSCLWRSEICLQELRLGRLHIQLKQDESGTAVAGGPPQQWQSPVSLSVAQLVAGQVHIEWPDGQWQGSALTAAFSLASSHLDISALDLQRAKLVVAGTEAPQPSNMVLPPIYLPLALQLGELTVHAMALDVAGEQQQLQQIHIAGLWQEHVLRLDQLNVVHPQWGDLQLQAELTLTEEWATQLQATLQLAQPPVEPLQHSTVDLQLQGTLGALAGSLQLRGTHSLDAQLTADLLDQYLPFTLRVQGAGQQAVELVAPTENGWPGQGVYLAPQFELDVRGDRRQQTVMGQGALSGLHAQPTAIDLVAQYEDGIVQLKPLSLGGGQLQAAGTLTVQPGLQWDLQVSARELSLPEMEQIDSGLLSGGFNTQGSVNDGDWQFAVDSVDLTGSVNKLPAQIRGGASVSSHRWLESGAIKALLNGAQFELAAAPGGQRGEAIFGLEVAELARWLPEARGRVSLAGRLGLDTRNFSVEGFIEQFSWGELSLDRVDLQGQGDQEFGRLDLASEGDIATQLSLTASYANPRWDASLKATTLDTRWGQFSLEDNLAVTLNHDSQQAVVAPHCWRQAQTQLCVQESKLVQGRATSRLDLAGDWADLEHLLPQGIRLRGTLNSQLDVAWSEPAGLQLTGGLDIGAGQASRKLTEDEIAIARWTGGSLSVSMNSGLLDLAGELGVLDGTASLQLSLPQQAQGAISGELRLSQLQLDSVNALIPELAQLQGKMNGRVGLSGSVQAPAMQGEIRIEDGLLRATGNPTELRQLDLAMRFTGSDASIAGTGLLGGGEIQLQGSLGVYPDLRLDMSVNGSRHQLAYPPLFGVEMSQQLQLTVNEGVMMITGDVKVHNGVLELDQLPEGSVDVSPDVVVVDYRREARPLRKALEVGMDLQVAIRDEFEVRSNLVNTTVGGNLHLVQKPATPLLLYGNLETLAGEVRLLGQHLQVEQGNINFAGPVDNPQLNLRAGRTIVAEDVSVGVTVRGNLEAPQLEVYSDPVMSQAEAMSYLTRGRGLDAGVGDDSSALALSMGLSAINQTGVLTGLEKLPGIRNVELGTDSTEAGTTATVSGYLGDRMYLSYGTGIYEPITVLTARLYLQSRLWLEMVSSLENSLDIYYSFDID